MKRHMRYYTIMIQVLDIPQYLEELRYQELEGMIIANNRAIIGQLEQQVYVPQYGRVLKF